MSTEPKLTLFHNDVDWVVAESPADATAVWSEAMGPGADYPEDAGWEPWGEDKPLTIDMDPGSPVPEKLTLTGAQWAARGRAYIGSTEY